MFTKVRGAVEALKATARALDPACIDGHDAAALFDAVSEGERVCGALKALLARRIEETKVWRATGHRSAAHWVADATGETVGAACRTLETARALDGLPETDAAFRAGRLSPTQAAEITSAAGADPAAETELLDAAGSTSVKGLKDRCRQVRAGAELDDQAWARHLHLGRRAHDWTDAEGFYRLEGRLAPDAGARFQSAWQAHIDRIFRDARRAGVREPRAAYAADALVALATDGPCKPVEVGVVVDQPAIARGHTEAGERCEVTGVGPVPVTTVRTLLNDASVVTLIRDGDDITAVTSPKRVIPAKLRQALEARYPTCGVKACANDQFLQIDHVVPLEVTAENLARCVTLTGAWPLKPVSGQRYVIGVDVGLKNDWTAIAVAHSETRGRDRHVILDDLVTYKPVRGQQVLVSTVEDRVYQLARKFGGARVFFDENQATGMIQNLQAKGVRVEAVPFTARSNDKIATLLHTKLRDGLIDLPDVDELLDELLTVRVVETSHGLLSIDTRPGLHDDQTDALGVVVMRLLERPESRGGYAVSAARRMVDIYDTGRSW